MSGVVEKAAAMAKRTSPAETKRSAKQQLAVVAAQVERGTMLLDNLLGIEQVSKQKLADGLVVLQHEQTDLQNRVTLGARYHLLSMEPLTWRDTDGWPQLAVFSLDSPRFEIAVSGDTESAPWHKSPRYTVKMFPKLPDVIATCYEDVQKALRQRASKRQKTVKLSCRFEGLIPDDVKQKIAEARSVFKEIFVIAEPSGWALNETAVVIPKRDPLVVGFDGSQLWLIADFETTPVEEAMIFTLPNSAPTRA